MSEAQNNSTLDAAFAHAKEQGARHIVDDKGRTLVRGPYGGFNVVVGDGKDHLRHNVGAYSPYIK